MALKLPAVNKPEATVEINYCAFFVDQAVTKKSPIDVFYAVCSDLVKLTKPEIVNDNPIVTRLLLLGYVSAVEEYLRSIFCEVINICPCAKRNASEKMIRFGALEYYELDRLAEGIFEASSLASLDEVKKKSNELLGINIQQQPSLSNALEKFDKICHLRHCAVHGGGTLNGHNAKQLGLSKEYVKQKLQPNGTILQNALLVCFSFVRAFNQTVFEQTLQRWIGEKKITGQWQRDKKDFGNLLDLFWSVNDNSARPKDNLVYRAIIPGSLKKTR